MVFWKKTLTEQNTPQKSEVTDNSTSSKQFGTPSILPDNRPVLDTGIPVSPSYVKDSKRDSGGINIKELQSADAQSNNKENPLFDSLQNKPEDYTKYRSALCEGSSIQGKLSFDANVRIDGNLNGQIYSSKCLLIGKKAKIDADIEVDSLIVFGSIKGNIKVKNRIEIHENAEVGGTLTYSELIVKEGALFNAECMRNKEAKPTREFLSGKGETTIVETDIDFRENHDALSDNKALAGDDEERQLEIFALTDKMTQYNEDQNTEESSSGVVMKGEESRITSLSLDESSPIKKSTVVLNEERFL